MDKHTIAVVVGAAVVGSTPRHHHHRHRTYIDISKKEIKAWTMSICCLLLLLLAELLKLPITTWK